ncbi:hypothetical protein BBJ28_00005656 [Nothophytophthora sp. Chile5]|nr:hypothetical protein BBJ28_00005656 [Nothophytophthora sp. Chile5]
MIRTSQRELLDRSRPAPVPMPPSNDISSGLLETLQTGPAAMVKEELIPVQSSATEATLGNLQELSINETSRADAEQPPPPPANGAEQAKRTSAASMVDLTLDDEVETFPRNSPAVPQVPPRVKQEPHVKAESAWLESAASAPSQSVLDVDELMEKALGDDDDPLLRMMVGQYNHLSVQIYNTDQEVAKIRDRVKELRNAQPMNMAEVQKAHQGVAQLRPVLAKHTQDRNEAVAQIVVYLKSDPQELKAFLDQCTADVPYAQVACHHKCAAMEASIRAKLESVQQLQRGMEDAIGMKKENAFAEVMRLGAEIAAGEAEVKKLDQDRLNEFTTLCQFSSQIQQAVRTKSSQNS